MCMKKSSQQTQRVLLSFPSFRLNVLIVDLRKRWKYVYQTCLSLLLESLAKFMRRTQAATIIQKYQRMCVERKRYRQKQAAALAMQTVLRAYMARQKYQAVRRNTQRHI